MILEIIRNVLAFNLVFSDCLQAYSIFPPVEKSLFYQGLYIMNVHPLPNHTRCKTSWTRIKMAVFRASSVLLLLLHDIPFQMQITTADQLVFFVLPWVNFVLPWVNFVLPWVNLVLPWVKFVCRDFLLCRDSCGPPQVTLINRESLKEIGDMACVTPARSSRGQTLKSTHFVY